MKKMLGIGLSIAALLVFWVLVVFVMSQFRKIPSDSDLKFFFVQHEGVFTTLKGILSSEPPEIVGVTRHDIMFKEPWHRVLPKEANMSTGRFEAYQKLMSKNGINQVWRHNGEIIISAGFSGGGFAGKGPRLAYVYRLDQPTNQVQTLDGIKKSNPGWTTVYRQLGNKWFIRLTL